MLTKNIIPNPNNPRLIKDDKFNKLVQSIKDFPQMLELRPIVLDENNMVLGGNMRLKACIELGLKEVPTIQAKDLTEDQKKEFVIKDNTGFGIWDWDVLANEWNIEELEAWGLDLPDIKTSQQGETEINEDFEFAEDLGIEREYVLIVFSNKTDYKEAVEKFGLKKQIERTHEKTELNNTGTQRVINYENLRPVFK